MLVNYDELVERIAQAGYFATSPENMGDWSRVILCSKKSNGQFGGNSFWAANTPAGWFVGAWGGLAYFIASMDFVIALTIDLFQTEAERAVWDFSDALKQKYNLIEAPDDALIDGRET